MDSFQFISRFQLDSKNSNKKDKCEKKNDFFSNEFSRPFKMLFWQKFISKKKIQFFFHFKGNFWFLALQLKNVKVCY